MYQFTPLMKVTLESGVRATANLVRREQRLKVLQEAMKVVEGPVQNCELRVFIVKTWYWLSKIALRYWCRTFVIFPKPKTC